MGRKSKIKKVRFRKSIVEIIEVLKYISYTQLTGTQTKFYIDIYSFVHDQVVDT